MRELIDIEQGTNEWLDLRAGWVTGSKAACVMAHYGKAFGDPAVNYARKLAFERYSGKRVETTGFKNKAMENGNLYEPVARAMYEKQELYNVSSGGFYTYDTDILHMADSPDGLIGQDYCIEIKVVEVNAFLERLEKGGIDTAYKWQVQNHLWVCDRLWCDCIYMCMDFKLSERLYIHRVHRDETMINKLETRMILFEQLIQQIIERLESRS